MKKLITLLLIITFVILVKVNVFSKTIDNEGTTSITITGTYQKAQAADVISVDISWGAMSFVYKEASLGTWNPTTHMYEGSQSAGWNISGNDITLKNHSNVKIMSNFSFTKTIDGLTSGFYNDSEYTNQLTDSTPIILNSAIGTTYNEAPNATVYFTLSGTPLNISDNDTIITFGNVNVAISKVTP